MCCGFGPKALFERKSGENVVGGVCRVSTLLCMLLYSAQVLDLFGREAAANYLLNHMAYLQQFSPGLS